jgi:hypothetical protein
MKSASRYYRSGDHEMSHIEDHDLRLLLIVSALIGLAGLLASIFWRVALGIGILIIFTAALLFLALVGLIVGPLTTCAVASWRAVGRRQWDKGVALGP